MYLTLNCKVYLKLYMYCKDDGPTIFTVYFTLLVHKVFIFFAVSYKFISKEKVLSDLLLRALFDTFWLLIR